MRPAIRLSCGSNRGDPSFHSWCSSRGEACSAASPMDHPREGPRISFAIGSMRKALGLWFCPIPSTTREYSTLHSRSFLSRTGRSRAPRSLPAALTAMACRQTPSFSVGAWRARIAQPLHAALRQRGKGIELFVAMAGASALPNTLPGLAGLKPAASGLATVKGAYLSWLLQCLADQNRAAGHVVVDADEFTREMTGDFPVGLAASAMRYRDGAFASDPAGDAREVGTAQYGAFPPLALMTHASALDARHALMDRSTWGVYITQQLCETLVFSQADRLAALPSEKWALLVERVGHAAQRLSATLPGNHMFFLGENGARRTVQTLKLLRQTAADVAGEISQPMD